MTSLEGKGRGYARIAEDRQLHFRYAAPKGAAARPPLICVHCSPISSRVFDALLPVMAQDRLAIAFDTPGYGASDPLPTKASIEGFGEALFQGLDDLGVEGPVDLFGYHTGSATVVAMTNLAPQRVGQVAMISALMFSDTEKALVPGFHARDRMSVDERAKGFPQGWASWRKFWPQVPTDEIAWPMYLDSQLRPRGQYDGFFAAFDYDFPAGVAALDRPILVFNPSDDLNEITPAVAPLLKPGGRVEDLPGFAHGFLHAHTEEVANRLRAWLDR